MAQRSREIHLAARPNGLPTASDFALVEVETPTPGEGEVVIRNVFLSVDPYMRGRMNDTRSYIPPFALGEPMTGDAVGEVVTSRNPDWPVGTWVLHMLGWREMSLSDGAGLIRIDPELAPVSTALGVLGMPGQTAFVGLLDVGRIREGDAVYVSGAAGAVGGIVCQLALRHGAAQVVGSAGSAAKVEWLRSIGVDAFDHRETAVRDGIRERAPKGIDLVFDNVGGETLEAAIDATRPHGRIVCCGAISMYNATERPTGPRNLFMVVTKRLRVEGFIVSDHGDRTPAFLAEVAPLVRDGLLQAPETVVEGIERMPEAFVGLFRGDNLGKMVVRV